jgi:hypothetical protein
MKAISIVYSPSGRIREPVAILLLSRQGAGDLYDGRQWKRTKTFKGLRMGLIAEYRAEGIIRG